MAQRHWLFAKRRRDHRSHDDRQRVAGHGRHRVGKKAAGLRPALPILFASGYAENIDVPPGMHMIGKPFSIDQLRDKVKSILGQ